MIIIQALPLLTTSDGGSFSVVTAGTADSDTQFRHNEWARTVQSSHRIKLEYRGHSEDKGRVYS